MQNASSVGASGDTNDRIADPDKFTLNAWYLASIYWPILMRVAKINQGRAVKDFDLIQYARLVESAKAAHPDDPVVGNAINTSIGSKLDPINWFCRDNGLPNLSCLAVDANGVPGRGYMRNNDWEAEKAEVAAFDWSACDLKFQGVIKTRCASRIAQDAAKAATRRNKVKENVARDLLFKWWSPLRNAYPDISYEQRERMVKLLRTGLPVEDAVVTVLGAR